MRNAGCVILWMVLAIGCKEEAGPRPDRAAEAACAREPELDLDDFCDQSASWRDECERYERYDDALAAAIEDCTATGFPLAIGDCELRVIDRTTPSGGTRYYYDPDDDRLVGVRVVYEQTFECPESSPRDESVDVQTAGRTIDECDACLVCGAALADAGVCSGEIAEPYVERCRDTFDFAADCEPCACEACYPFTYADIASTAEMFHLCVADHCPACTMSPDEDGGMSGPEEDAGASMPPDEDAGR